KMGDEESDEDLLSYMVSSKANSDSIMSCVFQGRENARAVRDQISEEMWVELNALWLSLKMLDGEAEDKHSKMCEQVIQSSMKFRGIINTSLPRTDVWAFVQLGEYLERADKTSRIVDLPNFLPKSQEESAWNTMLLACSATAEHRLRNKGEVDASTVSTLLLFSTTFPRSVRFSVRRINELLRMISGAQAGEYLNEAERETGLLLSRLNYSGVEEIGERGLHDYVDSLQIDLNRIGHSLMIRYFLLRRDQPRGDAEQFFNSQMQQQVERIRQREQEQQQQ
ncbi:MAG: alpha-E domain-containing protein, partial [Verrucomicrobiota bacterium]